MSIHLNIYTNTGETKVLYQFAEASLNQSGLRHVRSLAWKKALCRIPLQCINEQKNRGSIYYAGIGEDKTVGELAKYISQVRERPRLRITRGTVKLWEGLAELLPAEYRDLYFRSLIPRGQLFTISIKT